MELKLKRPWRDGTTHLKLSPLAFMEWLACMVPGPRGGLSDDRFKALNLANTMPGLGRALTADPPNSLVETCHPT